MVSKRLFFAMDVAADWPPELPSGRIIAEADRHLTLAFLGNVPFEPLKAILKELPLPSFREVKGLFDKSLFLPPGEPRVAAWHVHFSDDHVKNYQCELANFLRTKGYPIEERPFLPHVTLTRAPFSISEWEEAFTPIPCRVKSFNLYESVGDLHYKPVWP